MSQEQSQGNTMALPSTADKMHFMFLLKSNSGQGLSDQQPHVQHVSQPNPIFEHIQTLSVQDSQANSSCLLVFSPAQLEPERGMSWVRGLMSVVKPQHTLAVASLPVKPSLWCIQHLLHV